MRKVSVKINDNKNVEVTTETIGYVEESNATQLQIMLNTELQDNDIDYHIVSFRHGNNDEKLISGRIYHSEDPEIETEFYRVEDKLYIMLPQYVTGYPNIFVQVEGHIAKIDEETGEEYIHTIIKSPVFFIKLDESLVGGDGEFNYKVEGIFSDLQNMSSKLESALPTLEMIEDGVTWSSISNKPSVNSGIAANSVIIGRRNRSEVEGSDSVTVGFNLIVMAEKTVLLGRHGIITDDDIAFAVANGTEEMPHTAFKISGDYASFDTPLYGITPSQSASSNEIPTAEWVGTYVNNNVYSRYDDKIAEMEDDLSYLKTELPTEIDTVSMEIIEMKSDYNEKISKVRPVVSDVLVLTDSGWTLNENGKYSQTVLIGMNTLKRNEIDVETESLEEWGKCFVLAVNESSNGIVFECNEKPENNLKFRITSTEVYYAV